MEKKVTLEQSDWDNVVDAIRYAAEARSYQADCTDDEEDKQSIQACADGWTKLADEIEVAIS